jgi:hypothetical protein
VSTLAQARRVALSLPEATEQDHHGLPSFRVRNKIFATVPDDAHLRVMLDPDMARAVAETDPETFEQLWWGKKLCGVTVTLAKVGGAALAELLEQAWRRQAPRRLAAARDSAAAAVRPRR